ncbi:MAG: zinc ribbon domain-containing protein [Promethearchaeota archaeon]
MTSRSWLRTDRTWILVTIILFILAFSAHIWIQFTGGYSAGSYLDMIPHFLFGAAICAFLLNFNLAQSWKKALPLIPPLLLIILPAILYTLAAAFAWEIYEEFLSIFFPWLGVYSNFWWNGVRDIIMGLLGATLFAGLYLRHFPTLIEKQDALVSTKPKTREVQYIPGKSSMQYCENCGSVIEPGSNHCSHCGHKL